MRDRAVSQTLGYVLTLAISTLLVTGLVVAGAGFVDDQRDRVIRQELEVIGQQVAAGVEQADRLVAASGSDPGTSVRVTRSIPDRVVGSTYTLEMRAGSPPSVRLTATAVDASVDVNLSVGTPVAAGSVADGGEVAVRWDPTAGDLVIVDV